MKHALTGVALACAAFSSQATNLRTPYLYAPAAKTAIENAGSTITADAAARNSSLNTTLDNSNGGAANPWKASVAGASLAPSTYNGTPASTAWSSSPTDPAVQNARRLANADVIVIVTATSGDTAASSGGYSCPKKVKESVVSMDYRSTTFQKIAGQLMCASPDNFFWIYKQTGTLNCRTRYDVMATGNIVQQSAYLDTWIDTEPILAYNSQPTQNVYGIGGSADNSNSSMVAQCPGADGSQGPLLTFTCATRLPVCSLAAGGGSATCAHTRTTTAHDGQGNITGVNNVNTFSTSVKDSWLWTCPLEAINVFGRSSVTSDGQVTSDQSFPNGPGDKILDAIIKMVNFRNQEKAAIHWGIVPRHYP